LLPPQQIADNHDKDSQRSQKNSGSYRISHLSSCFILDCGIYRMQIWRKLYGRALCPTKIASHSKYPPTII
jgi:hypothetical protein